MANARLEALKNMVAANPANGFARYGLAMEFRSAGDLEAAVREFQTLLESDPDYAAAYFHGGQTLERLGRLEEARRWYTDGIEAATRKGDAHTRDELRAAAELLG